jgi:acetoin utilization deacetylase AcuC-like enzyme
MKFPIFFDRRQLAHKPIYEWAMGEKLDHPETTHRAETILAAIEAEPELFRVVSPQVISTDLIRRVHVGELLALYEKAEREIPVGTSFYPSVFPKRRETRADLSDIRQAGYFCFDSGTPLTSSTWLAARLSASCAHDAANYVESGQGKIAYALCRPPGHHASYDLFGGYCYFNNAAIIAKRVREKCRVVILDIDFHHGNGTQDIFYHDDQVLFISIHGDPNEFYPFFSGHANEEGDGTGKGFTHNIPLPRGCDAQEYMKQLTTKVIPMIQAYQPGLLIISAGFDTYREDPIGAFTLDTPDYFEMSDKLAKLDIPTIILQEGGYCVEKLGVNVTTFLKGFL